MLTIGEFSRMCHVSARMLRHYDAIGLLHPVHTGPGNGYRYYDESQLAVLIRIETLKDYGFTLAQIPELLALPREELAMRLHSRRIKAYEELNALRATLRRMERDIMKMEGKNMVQENYHVIVMETPAQRVLSLRRRINIGEIHELFADLMGDMARRGLRRAGVIQLLYHDEEFSCENMDVEAQVEVAGDDPDVREIPPRLCAATTHVGPYDTLKFAYDALCAWMAGHPEYRIAGPAVERYLRDAQSAADHDACETGVLFPIVKPQ